MDSGSPWRTSEVSGTGPSPQRPAGGPAAAGWGPLSACRATHSPGRRSRERRESGVHCVLVSNFLLLSILFGENNVLNKALASSAGAHPTAGRWRLREDSEIWWPIRIPASLLFHPWALERVPSNLIYEYYF